MAEAYQIDIDASGAITELGKLETATDKTGNSAASLKSQLRVMQQELSNLDPNSEAFDQLSRKTGEIKDKINDAAEATRANAGPAFESLGNNFGLLTQRLGNLDFEGVGQSLKGMAGSIKGLSFKEITAGIGGMTSGIVTLGKAILANPILLLASVIIGIAMNFDKLLKVFPGLNEALNGVSEELSNQLDAQTKAYEQDKKKLDALSAQEESLKRQGFSEGEILDMKIAQAQETRRDLERRLLTQRQIVKDQIETAKRNRDILKGFIEFVTFPLQALLGSVDMLTERLHAFGVISDDIYNSVGNLRDRFNTSIAELVFDPEQVAADGAKTLEEMDATLKAMQNTEDGYRNQKDAKAKTARDKTTDDAKKAAEAALALETKNNALINQIKNDNIAEEEARAEEIYQLSLSARERELLAVQDAYFEKRTLAGENAEAVAVLTEEERKKRAEINKKYDDAEIEAAKEKAGIQAEITLAGLSDQDKELAAVAKAYDDKIALAQKHGLDATALVEEKGKKEAEINKKYADEDIAKEKQKQSAKLQAISGGLDSLMALNDSFHASNKKDAKRQFQINKGLSIASATLKTYESATAAFATGTATGVPGLGFVYAAIAVAAGLANINKIRQSKFDEGGNSSTPTPTAPPSGGGTPPIAPNTGQQPQFNALNTSFLNNKPNQVTPQAYVLAGGVASSLEAEQKIRDRARL